MAISIYISHKPSLSRCDDTMGEMSLAITCNYISSRNFSYLKNNNNSINKYMNIYEHECHMLQFPYICQGYVWSSFEWTKVTITTHTHTRPKNRTIFWYRDRRRTAVIVKEFDIVHELSTYVLITCLRNHLNDW